MQATAGRILRSSDVNFEGRFHLDITSAASAGPKTNRAPSAAPQARIVQNDAQFALLEITCSCGAKTHVKCQYTAPQTGNQESEQTN